MSGQPMNLQGWASGMFYITQTVVKMICTKTTPVKTYYRKRYYLMKPVLLLATLFISGAAQAAVPEDPPVGFTDSSFQEVQQQAEREGKLFFLQFTADKVATCSWMERHTFADASLTDYIADAYLAVRIDVMKPEGAKLQHKYNVNQLPTTLIFSSKGTLLGRLEGKQKADVFLTALKEYDSPENRAQPERTKGGRAIAVAQHHGSTGHRTLYGKVSRPRLVPDVNPVPPGEASQAYATPTDKPRYDAGRWEQQYTSIYTAPETVEESAPSAFYSVQVGVFSKYQNAEAAKRYLERRHRLNGHIIYLRPDDGSKKFRLCAGEFNSREAAAQRQQLLRTDYPDSFVKWVDQ